MFEYGFCASVISDTAWCQIGNTMCECCKVGSQKRPRSGIWCSRTRSYTPRLYMHTNTCVNAYAALVCVHASVSVCVCVTETDVSFCFCFCVPVLPKCKNKEMFSTLAIKLTPTPRSCRVERRARQSEEPRNRRQKDCCERCFKSNFA